MNMDEVYFCCLYGNNENEVIIRHIERDPDYEAEMIALEGNFWNDHVLTQTPPPYTEDGELRATSCCSRPLVWGDVNGEERYL